MVIRILSNTYKAGYLEKEKESIMAPFFGGGNIAFRREALGEVGGFDPQCITGEEVDICIRIGRTGRELFYEPTAIVKHKNPSTLNGLVQQWVKYGFYHAYVFKKHNLKAIEIFAYHRNKGGQSRFKCVFSRRSPVRVLIILSHFLLFHLFLLLSVLFFFLEVPAMAFLWALFAGLWGIKYFRSGKPVPKKRVLSFAFIRYVLNLSLLVGGVVGGVVRGMLYVYGAHES